MATTILCMGEHMTLITKSYRIVFGIETPAQAIVAKRWLSLAIKRDPRLINVVPYYLRYLAKFERASA